MPSSAFKADLEIKFNARMKINIRFIGVLFNSGAKLLEKKGLTQFFRVIRAWHRRIVAVSMVFLTLAPAKWGIKRVFPACFRDPVTIVSGTYHLSNQPIYRRCQ